MTVRADYLADAHIAKAFDVEDNALPLPTSPPRMVGAAATRPCSRRSSFANRMSSGPALRLLRARVIDDDREPARAGYRYGSGTSVTGGHQLPSGHELEEVVVGR